MLKKLMQSIREYRKASILTPALIMGEVIMECLIPFIIAMLVNEIKAGCGFGTIAYYGGIPFWDGLPRAGFWRGGGGRQRHRGLRLRQEPAQGLFLPGAGLFV
jgi:hypothetical protein